MPEISRSSRMLRAGGVGVVLAASSILLTLWTAARADEAVTKSTKNEPALYKQLLELKVAKTEEGQKLEDFCSDSEGRILALVGAAGPNDFDGDSSLGGLAVRLLNGSKKKKAPKFEPAVYVYDAAGKLVATWAIGFPGEAINTAPDGTVLVGGSGRVARFDLAGKKLLETESPQMTYIKEHADDMRERAKEQLETDRAMFADQVKEYEDQLKELQANKENAEKKKAAAKKDGASKEQKDKQDAESSTEDEEEDSVQSTQFEERNLKQIITQLKQQAKQMEKKTIEQALQQVVGRARTIHAISASQDNVFVTCHAMSGYGYGIWRTDNKFDNAKEIVKSLSGCCGQMDVQCRNGELYVCENSRHRVVRFDLDGKELGQFGKRDREGEGENFSGCCNPMNLCFNKDGNLFVSESNGVVKHFTPDGKYLGLVGVAKVQAGCKNSCVAVNADESRLYYIDIEKSKIIVLSRGEEQASK